MVAEYCKKIFDKGIKECTNEEIYVALLHMTKDMAEGKESNGAQKRKKTTCR